MPTYQEIQEALSKQINYSELARLLEVDLNAIAVELITDPTESIEFEVFFEQGEFETAIPVNAQGEGSLFIYFVIILY